MIVFKLVKKELMHFFKNKMDIVTMVIFPIVLILVMGTSLKGIMNVDTNIFKDEVVYYSIDCKNNTYIKNFEIIKSNLEKNYNIKFKLIEDIITAKENVNLEKSLAYISINNNGYEFYRNENGENISQKIFRNMFEQFLHKNSLVETISENNINIVNYKSINEQVINLKEKNLNSNGVDSYTYYTFAELVLIILYISSITSISLYKEKYLNTMSRMRICNISYLSILTSKVVLGIIIGIIQISVVFIVSRFMLNVNWGNNLGSIFLVLICLIIFSSILGVVTSVIFKDHKTSTSVCNILIIIMGLLGGSYMPISLITSSPITNLVAKISPTYWANISILSLSYGIKTIYPYISIIISIGLSAFLTLIGLIFYKNKAGESIV
ncbi:MAG: ABC transporter permease [Clostridium sp.]|nr:ABC transporter permease [Clostridium sp.]